MRFWIHVRPQINEARMKRLAIGDRVVFYAPHPDQHFSAIGEVREGGQIEMLPSTPAAIHPLIASLDFIRDKAQWGWVFRRGFFEITESDYRTLESAINAESSLLAAAR